MKNPHPVSFEKRLNEFEARLAAMSASLIRALSEADVRIRYLETEIARMGGSRAVADAAVERIAAAAKDSQASTPGDGGAAG